MDKQKLLKKKFEKIGFETDMLTTHQSKLGKITILKLILNTSNFEKMKNVRLGNESPEMLKAWGKYESYKEIIEKIYGEPMLPFLYYNEVEERIVIDRVVEIPTLDNLRGEEKAKITASIEKVIKEDGLERELTALKVKYLFETKVTYEEKLNEMIVRYEEYKKKMLLEELEKNFTKEIHAILSNLNS